MPFRFVTVLFVSATALSACAAGGTDNAQSVTRGQAVFAKECAQCHGTEAAGTAPDLTGLRAQNDGFFPREFVRRFVLGQLARTDPDSPMPEFARTGLRHVYPDGGADGEVLEADFEDLLDYLEAIQT